MKIKTLFIYVLCAFGGVVTLASCSDDSDEQLATVGKFGEITIDRTRIGTNQWFTVTGPYENGSNLLNEEFFFLKDNGLPERAEIKDGKMSVSLYFTKPGKHTLTFRARNIGNFGGGTNKDVETTKEIDIVASDIRCNFWGETREETLRNLEHYKTKTDGSDGKTIMVLEKDCYGTIDYSSEAHWDITSSSSNYIEFEADRGVFYRFNDAGKLAKVEYQCVIKAPNTDIVKEFSIRNILLKKEYAFSVCKYSYSGNLTQEQETVLNGVIANINAGKEATDTDSQISELVKKGLKLRRDFTFGNTKGYIETAYGSGKFTIQYDFAPVGK